MNRNLYLGSFMALIISPFLHAQDAELQQQVWENSDVLPDTSISSHKVQTLFVIPICQRANTSGLSRSKHY